MNQQRRFAQSNLSLALTHTHTQSAWNTINVPVLFCSVFLFVFKCTSRIQVFFFIFDAGRNGCGKHQMRSIQNICERLVKNFNERATIYCQFERKANRPDSIEETKKEREQSNCGLRKNGSRFIKRERQKVWKLQEKSVEIYHAGRNRITHLHIS